MIFKHQKKKYIENKKKFSSESVKYLSVKTDANLNWKQHIYIIAIELNRANTLLFTIRHVNRHILGTINFVL